jgi:hypothetical protein
VTLSLQRFTSACLTVVASNRLNTYFSYAARLGPYKGISSLVDWFFGGRCLYVIILFSSLSQLEVYELVGIFCSLYGLPASGSCRMNETIGCSTTQQASCIFCWTKSSCSPFDGWRRRMLHLLLIIILGGQTHCSAWAFTSVLCILMLLLYWYHCKWSKAALLLKVFRFVNSSINKICF